MTQAPLPVLCDRCRAEGVAGEGEFAELAGLGDLLDFEPVQLQVNRVDGHSPEGQRAFIAALALLGSPARAADAIGKAAAGLDRLRKLPGAEGFNRAWEAAMAIYAEKERLRLSDSLNALIRAVPPVAVSGPAGAVAPPPGAEREPTEAERAEADKAMEEMLRILARKYFSKLEQERQARLEGRIAEADLYVRQITCLEVSLDMLSGDGMAILRDFRCRGFDLLHIAETDMSKLLDQARRIHWEQCGEPPRPEYPPLHLLVQQEGFAIEPLDATYSDHPDGLTHQEQQALHNERNARDAAAQIAWESEAREAAAEWRARLEAEGTPSPSRGEGEAPPGAGGEGPSRQPPPADDMDEEIRKP